MSCACQPSPRFRLGRCGCASWSRSTTPPNPRRDTRRKRRKSSRANGRKDKPQEGRKTLTKPVPEIPLELRAKTVKRGELQAVHVRCGRRKGLRIKVIDNQPTLFGDPA